jgi:hypothetical protein
VLKEILDDCDALVVKKEALYHKLTEIDLEGTTGEVQDPKLILNSIFMTRKQFEEHVEILKSLSAEKFNNMTEYTENEIESWLVSYVNKNEDIEDTLHQLSFELRELEGTIFDIKVRQEINVAPMKEYIENWLKQALIKITEEDQLEAVGIGRATTTRDDTRGTSTRK